MHCLTSLKGVCIEGNQATSLAIKSILQKSTLLYLSIDLYSLVVVFFFLVKIILISYYLFVQHILCQGET